MILFIPYLICNNLNESKQDAKKDEIIFLNVYKDIFEQNCLGQCVSDYAYIRAALHRLYLSLQKAEMLEREPFCLILPAELNQTPGTHVTPRCICNELLLHVDTNQTFKKRRYF